MILQAWMGAVTATTAVVKARTAEASCSATTDPSTDTFDGSEGNDDVFEVDLIGLTADTAYEVTVDDGDGTWVATFRTAPAGAASFSFAIGGDSGHSGGSYDVSGVSPTAPTWDSIAEDAPAFLIHCGDLHYKDISTDNIAAFRSAYQAVIADKCATMLQSVPIVYTWDDHDFGANDSNGTSASKPAACAAYREWVPHYPLDDDTGIWQSFTWGRVKFIVTDSRSDKDPRTDTDDADKTMLGTAQKEWLEAQLADAVDDPFVVLVIPTVFHMAATLSNDSWAGYTNERRWLATMLTRYSLTAKTLIVCADAHMLAYDDGRNTQYDPAAATRGPRLVQCGKIDAGTVNLGGPYSSGIFNTTTNMYMTVDVADSDGEITVTIHGWSVSGTTETEVINAQFAAGNLLPAGRWGRPEPDDPRRVALAVL